MPCMTRCNRPFGRGSLRRKFSVRSTPFRHHFAHFFAFFGSCLPLSCFLAAAIERVATEEDENADQDNQSNQWSVFLIQLLTPFLFCFLRSCILIARRLTS